jgi:hypothetical protein
LLAVQAVVGQGFQEIVGEAELFEVAIEGLEELIGNGFDCRAGILVVVEEVKALFFGLFVAVRKVDAYNLQL